MKIAFIATYPPRECGIGTFTQSLVHAIKDHNEVIIIAMHDGQENYPFPPEVKFTIRQEHQTDYLKAADFINQSDTDVCIVQHEFGIYGGQSGVYILPLLHRLQIPLISTLHTILQKPSYTEKAILKKICTMSDKLVVMSHKAIQFLEDIYHVPSAKILRIEHGVPDIHFDKEKSRAELKFTDKKLLLTFGFVGRNKGIETVIKALPEIIKKHPDIVYVVLGKTHPHLLRSEGEQYRNYLHLLIKTLKISDHVLLINEFAEEKALFKYLAACDIYITPYINEAQITSGTLTYAMGSGCVVVSTPYWHAVELLTGNKGCLFDFKDEHALTKVLNELFDKPQLMKTIQQKAEKYGQGIIWPKIGEKYIELAEQLTYDPVKPEQKNDTDIDPLLLPPFSLTHIKRLTDDTGIIQHAKFGIPNLKEGYCLDDNARAMLMACMAYKLKKNQIALDLMPIYLSYIHYMQNKDGTFRNFLSFNRNFLDEVGSEDSFGRTIWSLGYLMQNAPNDAFYQTARLVFFDAAPNFEKMKSIRGIANTMIGISYYLKANPGDLEIKMCLVRMTDVLVAHFEQNRSKDWDWFESLLAYDNGILPLALLHASQVLENKKAKDIAFESMNFLTTHTLKDGYLSVIGNRQWFIKDKERSVYAQQPIDAMAMVLAYHQAFVLTEDRKYLENIFTSYLWFLGENDLRLSLYDFETKGCCDGFEDYGINRNQGAESSLAYLISHLTVLQAYEESAHFREVSTSNNSVNHTTRHSETEISKID
ncbi:glycosyltransferase family 4 protein [Chryseobacterium salivictor]|uniref:GDP-mannose-dependent monoacylated alpha-(1-6)-phosphatidylinositol monomannoside mannosyltransferase n=1 Tax=Chryseobacterium salivictor TaxID=2547600 RepID=A0A4P6ZCD3_9FLAO|nr:glycosyltransferase family 4 protein [Chryseobacterium salivictor]QBO57065.1 GDP-mannose-dependent monoacylated alpha-(1-6)-phosphatidylinositol monomannoside mannosyltransferase [Chryseobacterium salivictor]